MIELSDRCRPAAIAVIGLLLSIGCHPREETTITAELRNASGTQITDVVLEWTGGQAQCGDLTAGALCSMRIAPVRESAMIVKFTRAGERIERTADTYVAPTLKGRVQLTLEDGDRISARSDLRVRR